VFAVNNKIEAADSQRAKNRDACTDSPDKIKIRWFLLTSPSRLIYVGTEEGAGIIFFVRLPGGSNSDMPSTYASNVRSLPCSQWTDLCGIAYIAKFLHTLITQQRMYLNQTHHHIRMISSASWETKPTTIWGSLCAVTLRDCFYSGKGLGRRDWKPPWVNIPAFILRNSASLGSGRLTFQPRLEPGTLGIWRWGSYQCNGRSVIVTAALPRYMRQR
jgi:hypothetical protein